MRLPFGVCSRPILHTEDITEKPPPRIRFKSPGVIRTGQVRLKIAQNRRPSTIFMLVHVN